MELGRLIKIFEKADQGKLLDRGLHEPHSWRGSYDELAFEPSDGPMLVSDVLAQLKSAVGQTYTGYKGGEFFMNEETEVHIEMWGDYTDGETERSFFVGLLIGK